MTHYEELAALFEAAADDWDNRSRETPPGYTPGYDPSNPTGRGKPLVYSTRRYDRALTLRAIAAVYRQAVEREAAQNVTSTGHEKGYQVGVGFGAVGSGVVSMGEPHATKPHDSWIVPLTNTIIGGQTAPIHTITFGSEPNTVTIHLDTGKVDYPGAADDAARTFWDAVQQVFPWALRQAQAAAAPTITLESERDCGCPEGVCERPNSTAYTAVYGTSDGDRTYWSCGRVTRKG